MSDEQNDDAPDIPPALNERQWQGFQFARGPIQLAIMDPPGLVCLVRSDEVQATAVLNDVNDLAALIALANEALRRFDDPRAILAKHVALLRKIADGRWESDIEEDKYGELHELADALASYLKPEA